MEVKFKRISLRANIAFYGGLVAGTILAKLIYPVDKGLWDCMLKIIKSYAFGGE